MDVRVERLRSRPVLVPLRPPLGSAAGRIDAAPLLLLDLLDSAGVTGTGYLFCYHPAVLAAAHALVEQLAGLVVGAPAAPRSLYAALPRRLRLLARDGVAAMVLGGLDMAAWDGAARRAGLPLVELLGAVPTPLPAYASLRSAEPGAAADEAARAAAAGFRAVKVKIGHGPLAADLTAIRTVRASVGAAVEIMVDYSAHLLAATPGRHWLEYLDLAEPLLANPTRPTDGHLTASTEPGAGLAWDDQAVAAHLATS